MRIAIYVRVSTDRQAEHAISMEDQIKQMTEWALNHNHVIVETYSEPGQSAFENSRRPVLESMIDAAMSDDHPFDAIVVHSQSRFYRNNMRRAITECELEKRGVQVISLTQPTPEDENSARLMKNLIGMMDEYQSGETSKHTIRCLKANAAQGFFNGAIPPYGYTSVKTDVPSRSGFKKRLAIHPEEAENVKLIFELAFHGDSGIPLGTKRIAEHLNLQGHRRRGLPWRAQSVHRVLQNTAYIGELVTFKRSAHQTKIRPQSEWVTTKIPPIVDPEIFDQVQSAMKARGPQVTNARALTSPSLLTGIIKCSKCGKGLQVITGKSGRYKYYRCPTKTQSSISLCDCPNISKDKIEKAVLSKLSEEVLSPVRLRVALVNLREKFLKASASEGKRVLALQGDVSRIKVRLKTLYEQLGESKIAMDDVLRDHIKSEQSRISSMESEIASLKKKQTLPLKSFGEQHLTAFIEAARDVLLSPDSPHAKAYVRALVKEIRVTKTTVTASGNEWDLFSVVSRWKPGTPLVGVPKHIPEWRARRDSNSRPLGS